MKTKFIASLFALAVIAQLWVPASMIFSSEKALVHGKAFKFKTAPVDPYDAFRGKYVSLDFQASIVDLPIYRGIADTTDPALSYNKKIYAVLEEDSSGFAKIARIQTLRPTNGFFVPVRVNRSFDNRISVQFPFTKFFMEEGKAKQAEELYQQQNSSGKLDSYAVVRVDTKGHAVIEDLVLGGIPILEALR